MPRRVLLDAGRYFREKQGLPADAGEEELLQTAVRAMTLDDLRPFDVNVRIID